MYTTSHAWHMRNCKPTKQSFRIVLTEHKKMKHGLCTVAGNHWPSDPVTGSCVTLTYLTSSTWKVDNRLNLSFPYSRRIDELGQVYYTTYVHQQHKKNMELMRRNQCKKCSFIEHTKAQIDNCLQRCPDFENGPPMCVKFERTTKVPKFDIQ